VILKAYSSQGLKLREDGMALRTIHTSTLFKPQTKSIEQDVSITVDEAMGCVVKVFKRDEALPDVLPESDIDLRGKFVMPGFVDAHTHIFLHSYDEAPSLNQKRDESFVERILRAANHCRVGLLAGYTTYR
jgi:imidazolonepropionase-like amidohydrolase